MDMKSAKEMFERLGWTFAPNDWSIAYKRGFRTIEFHRWDENTNIVTSSGHISMEVLKAINKQCEELGWLDD